MIELITILDNREKAILFWVFVLIIFFISKRMIQKKQMINLFKAFAQKIVLISFLLMVFYSFGIIYLFYKLEFWEISYLSTTVTWFIGIFMTLFLNMPKIRNIDYFIEVIKDNLKLLVFLEFIINLYVLPFIVELILFPFLVIVGGTLGYSTTSSKYKSTENFLLKVLLGFLIFLMCFTVYSIFSDMAGFLSWYNLKELLLPFIFTLLIIPYFYFLSLFLLYMDIFKLLGKKFLNRKLIIFSKFITVTHLNLKLKKLNDWYRFIALNEFSSIQELKFVVNKISK